MRNHVIMLFFHIGNFFRMNFKLQYLIILISYQNIYIILCLLYRI